MQMNENYMISVSLLYSFFEATKSYGLERGRLLEECGIDEDILSSPDNRFSVQQYDRLFSKAVELSGDSLFGLRLGQMVNIRTGNLATYLVWNCATLREALEKYIEYQKIIGEGIELFLSTQRENAVVTLNVMNNIVDNRYWFDSILSAVCMAGRELTDAELKLKEVHFKSTEPELHEEYRKVFNCTLKWKMPSYAIIFNKKFLEAPLKQPNKKLMAMFEDEARFTLRKMTGNETYTEKVIKIINNIKFSENLKIEHVAQKIPVNVRTLQMKLKEENSSFQQIVDEMRKQIAVTHLKNKAASIKEISYFLGFSEPAAFQRAFKKWTGKTPGEFRKEN